MRNYEYIIASLPLISQDSKSLGAQSEEEILQDILDQCSASDSALVDFLSSGWNETALCEDFYKKALSHKDGFIRRYFSYDLMLRNAKVAYLNSALGREEGKDTIQLEGFEPDQEELQRVESILRGDDLLQRERGLDDAMWNMIDEAVILEVFSFDIVLAFIAKLHIVTRWLKLDPHTGKEMFRRLVDEVRGTFRGVDYKE